MSERGGRADDEVAGSSGPGDWPGPRVNENCLTPTETSVMVPGSRGVGVGGRPARAGAVGRGRYGCVVRAAVHPRLLADPLRGEAGRRHPVHTRPGISWGLSGRSSTRSGPTSMAILAVD
jgi:hypothetical protein